MVVRGSHVSWVWEVVWCVGFREDGMPKSRPPKGQGQKPKPRSTQKTEARTQTADAKDSTQEGFEATECLKGLNFLRGLQGRGRLECLKLL